MAHFSSRVEVHGDPNLLQQNGMMNPELNMNMNMGGNMNMNVGLPGMSVQMSGNDQHVNMSMGMPGMPGMNVTSNVSDSSAAMAFKVNDPNMHMNMHVNQPQAHISMQTPQMHVSMPAPQVQIQMPQMQVQTPQMQVQMPQVQVQMPHMQVQMPQMQVQMPQMQVQVPQPMPQPVFGADFVVRVSEPHLVGEPPEQRTEYYFTLSTNLAEWGIYPAHRVSKRYNEVKQFHDRMVAVFGSRFPAFPEKNFFGRFNGDIISARMDKFQKMMDIIASDGRMRTHQHVKDFLFATPKPVVVHRPVHVTTMSNVSHHQPHHQVHHQVHVHHTPVHHQPHHNVHVHHHNVSHKVKAQAKINQLWRFEHGFIVSQMNGLVLDIKGGNREAGAEVCMWHKKATGDNANQKWRYENGYFVSQLNGLVLDIKGGAGNPGANLCLWHRKSGSDAENQKWKITKRGFIVSKMNSGTKLVLDIKGENKEPGAEVVVWSKK